MLEHDLQNEDWGRVFWISKNNFKSKRHKENDKSEYVRIKDFCSMKKTQEMF